MRAVIQRVTEAAVRVSGEVVGQIGPGLLILLGVSAEDTEANTDRLREKILRLRIFEDSDGKMNLSLSDVRGGLLVVSQFTLLADLSKGNRPSFGPAANPDQARKLYERFVAESRERHSGPVAAGRFGADMKVSLINDGPVTFVLDA